ncbi:hypothetical protein NP493_1127g01067 [Ridgeia piscesae]|nr:hypothetical protein NP493_1127g01067 [Ridgeia piscesae]
MEETRG